MDVVIQTFSNLLRYLQLGGQKFYGQNRQLSNVDPARSLGISPREVTSNLLRYIKHYMHWTHSVPKCASNPSKKLTTLRRDESKNESPRPIRLTGYPTRQSEIHLQRADAKTAKFRLHVTIIFLSHRHLIWPRLLTPGCQTAPLTWPLNLTILHLTTLDVSNPARTLASRRGVKCKPGQTRRRGRRRRRRGETENGLSTDRKVPLAFEKRLDRKTFPKIECLDALRSHKTPL